MLNALSEMEKKAQESVSLKDECEKKVTELNRLRAELKELKSKQQQSKHVIKLSAQAYFYFAFVLYFSFCTPFVRDATVAQVNFCLIQGTLLSAATAGQRRRLSIRFFSRSIGRYSICIVIHIDEV